MKNIVIFITTQTKDEAAVLAKALLNKKLVACVNIVGEVRSLYWWQGKIEDSYEALMVIKTKKSKFKALEKVVKSLHSYSVPEIIALPIIAGEKNYLKWIGESINP